MKSIQARFIIVSQRHPLLSSYIVMVKTVSGMRFSREAIAQWFPKLVVKGDYEMSDKQRLIDFLFERSLNGPRND